MGSRIKLGALSKTSTFRPCIIRDTSADIRAAISAGLSIVSVSWRIDSIWLSVKRIRLKTQCSTQIVHWPEIPPQPLPTSPCASIRHADCLLDPLQGRRPRTPPDKGELEGV